MDVHNEADLPEDIACALKEIVDEFQKEDQAVRERQIRFWKKLDYYWNGLQRVWWSEVAHDWRVFDLPQAEDVSNLQDQSYYDKPINVYRAYLESIIAALSVTVPPIKCQPDDADNLSDVLTAKGGTKIGELVYKHIDAPLLWVHALFTFCTQGMVAAYNYTDEDEKYGAVETPVYKEEEQEVTQKVCPMCKTQVIDPEAVQREHAEFDPDSDDAALHNMMFNQGQALCPSCMATVDPELQTQKVTVTRLEGLNTQLKSRQCVKVYGGLWVKVPNYAADQEACPYLIKSEEVHYTGVFKRFPHLREKRDKLTGKMIQAGGIYDPYERWGRLSTQYFGEYPLNTPTVRDCWLRPQSFEVIVDEEIRNKLYKRYPDGCHVAFVNDLLAEACNESLDDHWTITKNPLSNYVHFDPLGSLLTSVQEITNDLVSLILQTIEHGIPQTFADPEVLNFSQYSQTEASPGAVYPAKPRSGKAISDGFYELKSTSLSQEVEPFGEKIQELGQFVSGALPSLYGGEQSSGSKTAAQYAMSRAQSLQRLQNTWKMLLYWWKGAFGKVIPAYIKNMLEDEKWTQENPDGSFISILVKKSEMEGKIGNIELEANEQLPFTWGQKKDVIMQLFQNANPEIMQAITDPENAHLIADAIGLDDFVVPGEDDREKQLEEIQQLIQGGPIPGPPQQGPPVPGPNGQPIPGPPQQGPEMPSVMPEFLVDRHQVHGDVCRRYLVSEVGRQLKVTNPQGYKNILLHLQIHVQMMQQLGAMGGPPPSGPGGSPQQGGAPQGPPKPPMQKPPDQGATNVPGAQIH